MLGVASNNKSVVAFELKTGKVLYKVPGNTPLCFILLRKSESRFRGFNVFNRALSIVERGESLTRE